MVNPKIGLSMLYCLGEPFKKMTERLVNVRIKYVEIVDDGFHSLDRRRVAVLKDIQCSYCLRYSVHAPFADVNIASPSEHILKAMLRRLKHSIVCAHDLDAVVWVFHPGIATGISMFYPGMDWLQNLEAAKSLSSIAAEYGVKIAIENVPEPYPFLMKSVEDFKRFYAQVDGNIGLALDVGHANINAEVEKFLTTFRDKIVHMHLSDNDGKSDQHLGIGYGTISWERIVGLMRRMSYDKIAVVESVEHVEESLRKLGQLFV
jgi:sugar phosphate isomerase/epimerase